MDPINEFRWVCEPCMAKLGRWMSPRHVATWHIGECNICRQTKEITEPRDFALTAPPGV